MENTLRGYHDAPLITEANGGQGQIATKPRPPQTTRSRYGFTTYQCLPQVTAVAQ